MAEHETTEKTLWRGKFLEMAAAGKWEYVKRVKEASPVGIVAVTDANEILLISQYRVPVGKIIVEIPAGLVGDGANVNEGWEIAANRELREETGWAAERMEFLTRGPTSAGLTSECLVLAWAEGVRKVGEQTPDGDEAITVHVVPLAEVDAFLQQAATAGKLIDPKVYAALYFAMLRRG